MTDNPYILDIFSQPEALQTALHSFDPTTLAPFAEAIHHGDFDRVLLSGMGSSLYAAYPAWLTLAAAGVPAMWVDTAELIHHTPGLITPKTLFWLFSQSGKSAEIVSALDFTRMPRPAAFLATVNDLESPLADTARTFDGLATFLHINAVPELTVSTRTFTNALAVGQLGALALLGIDVEPARDSLQQTANAMKAYLSTWEQRVEKLAEQIGFPKRLAVLGRGASMASVWTGTLILGEASKFLAASYQAGEFRHGPLELANPDLTVLLLGGPVETRELNQRLFQELRGYHVNAFWVGAGNHDGQIEIPDVPAIGLPLLEILPIQLLTIHLARQIGVEPGHFFRSGKITLSE
jgi:glucosamine--fructose-6-phosphate aminotransferase (isomerizing)